MIVDIKGVQMAIKIKPIKNNLLQGMLLKRLGKQAVPKVGAIPKLKNIPRPKTPKSFVGKRPF